VVVYASFLDDVRENQFTTFAIMFISSNFPLLLGDDSNTFLFQEKKRGGNAYDSQKIAGFQDFIAVLGLVDLGYAGHAFT
jgi:hypothetical protein